MGLFDDVDALQLGERAPQPPKDEKGPRPVVSKPNSLAELDLEQELLTQLTMAKQLYSDAQYDDEAPLNQKAQALGVATSIIVQITKTQTELYSAERMKTVENILISTLKDFPDIKAQFLEAYKKALNV